MGKVEFLELDNALLEARRALITAARLLKGRGYIAEAEVVAGMVRVMRSWVLSIAADQLPEDFNLSNLAGED